MSEARGREGDELEVRLLGPLEMSRAGRPVSVGGPKPRALLAALALDAGRVVSVDRLVESLWPGETPDSASHAVQVYVSQLRKLLGNRAIATRAPGYVLELDPAAVDVHRFARLVSEGRETLGAGDPTAASSLLREGLALWRGPALADFTYEPFAQTEIARLEDLRSVALEERIEADLALGRHAELVSELEALVESQPLRERPRAQLMLALYRSGRQADALAAYRTARETLVEELGIDPGPELRKLEAAILRQDETLLPPEGPAARAMQFRRLVTVLFADVVESMALADRLDAEALGLVLSGYFEVVSTALSRHGGAVEKYAGDAVMAVFGIPVSHEDDALRAARAALDIRAAVAALNERLVETHGVGLAIRIGIESGEVVTTPNQGLQRLVTGEAVGIASRLEETAGADEIVVGELAGRLIDHAARLEPLGELEIKGKREPVRAFRLIEIDPVAPAFGRRLEAALVGRKRELAALRRSLKRASDGSRVQAAFVLGSPGVGKSRLVAELVRRAKGVTTLWGRCLSYGEGITYWPLREVVQQAPESEERDVILAALEADTPPPAPEIAWRFRKLCEAVAREQPLVLVVDDLHWAEPTLLELVEHLVDRGEGPILVVCVAREEFLQERPTFLEDRENAESILLHALATDETEALLEGLGGAVLESDQRRRIVETAEGNPLFLEQLLALALEGGLAERGLPETIQSLLAARLDRLGPGERAVLERGAVVGKEFNADDVVSLLDPEAAPTAGAHLRTLSDRGFVRPRGEGVFGFRHVLVQEAVYRATPKRLRADLHERFADRLERTAVELPELDEFVGYHLEQGYRLRAELGESGRRMTRLAEDGGRRLGAAGFRAMTRGDMTASANLLRRATSLLPQEDSYGRELLCELAIAFRAVGDVSAADDALGDAIERSITANDRRIELRSRIERAYLRALSEPEGAVGEVLDLAERALPVLEALDDARSLGRLWLIKGWIEGGIQCRHKLREEAAERALGHYRGLRLSTSTPIGEIAASLYYGPTPVLDGISRCERLLEAEAMDLVAEANVLAFMGGLEALRGNFHRGRDLLGTAENTYSNLGQKVNALTYCYPVLADVELLAGNPSGAKRTLLALCETLEQMGDWSHLSSRAADLANVLVVLGLIDESEQWADTSALRGAAEDLATEIRLHAVRAHIRVAQRREGEAEAHARQAVQLSERTDALNLRGRALIALEDALRAGGDEPAAEECLDQALELFVQKGNTVLASRIVGVRTSKTVV